MSKYASHMYNLSYIGSHWDFKLLLSKQVRLKMEIAVIRILPLWARLLALSNLILHRSSLGFFRPWMCFILLKDFFQFCLHFTQICWSDHCFLCFVSKDSMHYTVPGTNLLFESGYFYKSCSFIWSYDHIHV